VVAIESSRLRLLHPCIIGEDRTTQRSWTGSPRPHAEDSQRPSAHLTMQAWLSLLREENSRQNLYMTCHHLSVKELSFLPCHRSSIPIYPCSPQSSLGNVVEEGAEEEPPGPQAAQSRLLQQGQQRVTVSSTEHVCTNLTGLRGLIH
jgi:hypothetical protein